MSESSQINHTFTPEEQTLFSSLTHLAFYSENTLRDRVSVSHTGILPSSDKVNSQIKSPREAFVNRYLRRYLSTP